MKKVFILLLAFNFSRCMELPLKTKISERIDKGFKAFGLDCHEIDVYGSTYYPQRGNHWEGGNRCIFLTKAVQGNLDLSEFAGHCIAASVKNNHTNKSLLAFFGIQGVSYLLPPVLMLLQKDPLYSACLGIATLSFPLMFISTRVCKKVDQTITNFFDLRAFSYACEKLVEQKNLKPLGTCYAFTSLMSQPHQKDKISLIKECLAKNNLTITCSFTNYNEARTSIWKDANCICKGAYQLPLAIQSGDYLVLSDTSDMIRISFIIQERP